MQTVEKMKFRRSLSENMEEHLAVNIQSVSLKSVLSSEKFKLTASLSCSILFTTGDQSRLLQTNSMNRIRENMKELFFSSRCAFCCSGPSSPVTQTPLPARALENQLQSVPPPSVQPEVSMRQFEILHLHSAANPVIRLQRSHHDL